MKRIEFEYFFCWGCLLLLFICSYFNSAFSQTEMAGPTVKCCKKTSGYMYVEIINKSNKDLKIEKIDVTTNISEKKELSCPCREKTKNGVFMIINKKTIKKGKDIDCYIPKGFNKITKVKIKHFMKNKHSSISKTETLKPKRFFFGKQRSIKVVYPNDLETNQ